MADIMLTYKHDMYLWHRHLLDIPQTYTFQQFQIDYCTQATFRHTIPSQVITCNTITIILHSLINHNKRRMCNICHTHRVSTYCKICSKDENNPIMVCEGISLKDVQLVRTT